MDLSTVVLISGLSGAILGIRKPWIGGIAGLISVPMLYFNSSSGIVFSTILTLLCGLFGLGSGLAGAMLMSGLRGKALRTGTSYVSGFGVHHPGGLFLSKEEREGLAHKDREIVVSY